MNWLIDNLGWPTVLIFLGGLLTLVGGVWSAIEKTRKENELSKNTFKIQETLTSAESFCYLLPSGVEMNPLALKFLLIHKGDNPIYDLNIRIALLEEHEALRTAKGKETQGDSEKIDQNLEIGNVGIDKIIILPKKMLPDYPKYTFDIYFEHLHGRFFQTLEMYRIEDDFKYRSVVKVLDETDTILYETANISEEEINRIQSK